jgi:hypothetical protein
MNASLDVSFASTRNVFADRTLSLDEVRDRAPAVFASAAHENLSDKYRFIPTERVLSGLISAGFVPVDARQARSRSASPVHAQHVVRLRRRYETISLKDSCPEILFLNSHDGSSAYLRWICSDTTSVKIRQSLGFRGINREQRIQ